MCALKSGTRSTQECNYTIQVLAAVLQSQKVSQTSQNLRLHFLE